MCRKVEVLKHLQILNAGMGVDRLRLRWAKFDGGMSTVQECFVVGVGQRATGVLAYDPVADCIILVEQFRVGAFMSKALLEGTGWTTEIVMGSLPDGEEPETVARLELHEEVGCVPEDMFEICRYLPDPANYAAVVWLFCARVTVPNDLAVRGNAYEQESIRPHIISSEKIPEFITRTSCANASTLLALQWFLLNRVEIRRRWCVN